MITNFTYNDIVLYCKGWYQREGNTMLQDLGYLFSQIYAWTPTKESEVAHMMMVALDRLCEEMEGSISPYRFYNKHALFMEEVQKRMRLYDQSMDMAIIYLVRSVFQGLSKDEIKLRCPHYGRKEYFRMGSLFGKFPISMTYAEMNRMAKKAFGE